MATSLKTPPYRYITYSPAYTLVPTYGCFNRCSYCNFRQEPGTASWLTLDQAAKTLISLAQAPLFRRVIEILVLSGEVHPRSPERQQWLQHIYKICEQALSISFLSHTNVGPLGFAEMAQLKTVNVSMGLMLEQVSPKLLTTVHRHAPSKDPALRLQQLAWAGKLGIPFTTGLLLGIGETAADWEVSLRAIAQIHRQWGHIQEVILQPYSPGRQEVWQGTGFDLARLPEVVAIARDELPKEITLQIPPNLIEQPEILLACLEAGARDLGGIGPRDEVNPSYPHLQPQALGQYLETAGWHLVPRLPIYPQYDDWLAPPLAAAVQHWRRYLETEEAVGLNLD